ATAGISDAHAAVDENLQFDIRVFFDSLDLFKRQLAGENNPGKAARLVKVRGARIRYGGLRAKMNLKFGSDPPRHGGVFQTGDNRAVNPDTCELARVIREPAHILVMRNDIYRHVYFRPAFAGEAAGFLDIVRGEITRPGAEAEFF